MDTSGDDESDGSCFDGDASADVFIEDDEWDHDDVARITDYFDVKENSRTNARYGLPSLLKAASSSSNSCLVSEGKFVREESPAIVSTARTAVTERDLQINRTGPKPFTSVSDERMHFKSHFVTFKRSLRRFLPQVVVSDASMTDRMSEDIPTVFLECDVAAVDYENFALPNKQWILSPLQDFVDFKNLCGFRSAAAFLGSGEEVLYRNAPVMKSMLSTLFTGSNICQSLLAIF